MKQSLRNYWNQWLSWLLALIATVIIVEFLLDGRAFRHTTAAEIFLNLSKILFVAVVFSAFCYIALQIADAETPDTFRHSAASMNRINRNIGDWERFADPLGLIRLILLVDWDPIGIFGYPRAMNEYDSYAAAIYDLLVSDASQEELVAYLRQTEAERMGVRGKSLANLQTVTMKLRLAFDISRTDFSADATEDNSQPYA